jgi:hypothetical protein
VDPEAVAPELNWYDVPGPLKATMWGVSALRLGWLATCGVAEPLGSGWPLLVVDVVDPPLVDVLDVVLPAPVVVVLRLVVVVVP